MHPREFRISSPVWVPDVVSAIEKLSEGLAASRPAEEQSHDEEQMHLLADIATTLWRMEKRLVEPGSAEPLEGMRKPYRHLRATFDAMDQVGMKILDHTGEIYDTGMSIKVIAFQPTKGLGGEIVTETVRPTVYFKDTRIQVGEVIVGTPEKI